MPMLMSAELYGEIRRRAVEYLVSQGKVTTDDAVNDLISSMLARASSGLPAFETKEYY